MLLSLSKDRVQKLLSDFGTPEANSLASGLLALIQDEFHLQDKARYEEAVKLLMDNQWSEEEARSMATLHESGEGVVGTEKVQCWVCRGPNAVYSDYCSQCQGNGYTFRLFVKKKDPEQKS